MDFIFGAEMNVTGMVPYDPEGKFGETTSVKTKN